MNRIDPCLPRLAALAVIVIGAWSGFAAAADCDGKYSAVDRDGQEYSVRFPTKRLAETLKGAKAGIAVEQRNLAVSYDAGYLVSRCREQALYWYAKAAASGDEAAKQWLARNQSFEALRSGPECADDKCFGANADDNRVAVLYSSVGKNNHYFAPVTINGRTAQGLIDTGASTVAMSAEMAKTFGIDSTQGKSGQSSTANGKIATTNVVVPLIDVAGIKLRNVPVSVGISDGMLIGMSFLSRVNISMSSGTLTMSKRQ